MGRGEVGINWYNYDLSHPMWVAVLLISFLGSEPEFRAGDGFDPLILFDKEEVLWETIIQVGDKRTLYFT